MGLKFSSDVVQSIMEEILCDMDVEVYIDDITVFRKDYDEHMEKVNEVLK